MTAADEPSRRPCVYLPRGWPRVGKSTHYGTLKAANPLLARVCRDDARQHLFGESGRLTYVQEEVISKGERAQAAALLDAGFDIYVDAMNLRKKWLQDWVNWAVAHGADYEVINLDGDVNECVARDLAAGAAGGRMVGEERIRDIANRFPRKQWPTILPTEKAAPQVVPYVPDESLPPAWIADIDGTLTQMADRSPYDYSRAMEDGTNEHVVHIIRKLAPEAAILNLTGRTDDCRDVTVQWLAVNNIPSTELHMRATGDGRPDWIVKNELFAKVRNRYRILGVFDDRLQVCRLWHELGVPLLRLGVPDHDDF